MAAARQPSQVKVRPVTRGQAFRAPTLADYWCAIHDLPATLQKGHIQRAKFRLGREAQLAVYYAPFEGPVNREARILLVGLTPGWTQTAIAYEVCRQQLREGATNAAALRAVRSEAPFAGMRDRLCGWLDGLGVEQWLEVGSTHELFEERRNLLQTTSLIRYPVFVGDRGENYRGAGRRSIQSPLLWSIIDAVFVPLLRKLPNALIVPMGVAVSGALRDLDVDPARCLYGFPHPSGANGHGPMQYREHHAKMRRVVALLPIAPVSSGRRRAGRATLPLDEEGRIAREYRSGG